MAQVPLIRRTTQLSAQIVAFCRYLREQGYRIGPSEEADALKAIQLLEAFRTPSDFYYCLQAVLSKNFRERQAFLEHYQSYWQEMARAVDAKIKDVAESGQHKSKPQKAKPAQAPSLQALKSWLYGQQTEEETELASYSIGDSGGLKDFSGFSENGLHEIVKIIHLLAQSLANRYSRRYRSSPQPGDFDLRQTLRANMRRGGDFLELRFRKQQRQKLQLVLLCDVSKSMDLYSRFLVQFLYAFQQNYRQIETFVFSTSLQRITTELQKSRFETVLAHLSDSVPNWSGGTKIGASFHRFLEDYGTQYLNHRSIVLILSDGWDTGDIDLLEDSMRKIQRKAGRIIWLNPLAGNPKYEAEVKGMATCMPFIDVFAPAHDVDSLRQVVKLLKSRSKTITKAPYKSSRVP
ncbi:MAG: VWA domain-containing protein [Bacteroidota bacterium]